MRTDQPTDRPTDQPTPLLTIELLSQLKTIVVNIDELLQRYSQGDAVNTLSCSKPPPHTVATLSTQEDRSSVDMILRRLDRLEMGQKKKIMVAGPNTPKKKSLLIVLFVDTALS